MALIGDKPQMPKPKNKRHYRKQQQLQAEQQAQSLAAQQARQKRIARWQFALVAFLCVFSLGAWAITGVVERRHSAAQQAALSQVQATTSTQAATFGAPVFGSSPRPKVQLAQYNGSSSTGQNSTRHVYDANGLRIATITNEGTAQQKTTRYLWDENLPEPQVIEEYEQVGTGPNVLTARYVYDDRPGVAPLAIYRRQEDGSMKLFHTLEDGHGSVRQLVNEQGQVTDSYHYDAWGNSLAGGSGSTPNPYRYNGQRLDADGNYHLRARQYNPATGRFLSHDPMLGDEEDPITLHRYAYGNGDPVNFADPSGKFAIADVTSSMTRAISIGSRAGRTAWNVYDKASTVKDAVDFSRSVLAGGMDPLLATQLATEILTRRRGGAVVKTVADKIDEIPIGNLDEFYRKAKDFAHRTDPGGIEAFEGALQELRVAQYMAKRFGKTVDFLPNQKGMGDILMDGRRYEIYSPNADNLQSLINQMSKKVSSGDGLVLNLSRYKGSESAQDVMAAIAAQKPQWSKRVHSAIDGDQIDNLIQ
jgi:RHS repeat-associated protein